MMPRRTEIHNLIAEGHVNHFEVIFFHSDRVLSIPSGAGFLQSTVAVKFFEILLLPRSSARVDKGNGNLLDLFVLDIYIYIRTVKRSGTRIRFNSEFHFCSHFFHDAIS